MTTQTHLELARAVVDEPEQPIAPKPGVTTMRLAVFNEQCGGRDRYALALPPNPRKMGRIKC